MPPADGDKGGEAAGDLLAAASEWPCPGCGGKLANPDEWGCASCQRKYPPALLKAASDYFDYAVQLSTGERIFFCHARLHGDWVTLLDVNTDSTPARPWEVTLGIPAPRGLDVRLDAIIWAADAPWGS